MLNQVVLSLIALLLPTYIIRWSFWGIPTTFLEILIYVALIFTLCQKNIWPRLKARLNNRVMLWVGLFIISSLIGVIVAGDKTVALGAFKGWVIDPIVVMIIVLCQTEVKKTYRTVVMGLGLSAVIVALWGILQSLGLLMIQLPSQLSDGGFTDYLVGHRAVGPFESPNYLAMYLVPVWFMLLGLKVTRPKAVGLRWVGLAIICLAVIATQSLGGWLALIAGLLMSFVFGPRRRSLSTNTRIMLWLMVLGVGLAVIILLPTKFESSIGPRMVIWRDAIGNIMDQPIFGQGLRQYSLSVEGQSHNHPHNLYLATWLYTGLLGLIALLGIVVKTLRNIKKSDLSFFLSYALVAILVHGLIDTTVWKNDLAILFWLIIGLFCLVDRPEVTKS